MAYTFASDLPDPNYKIGPGGQTLSTGEAGPGFASIKLINDQKMLVNRTNSQRLLARSIVGQKWKINITYHPMTRAEFEPVYSFLLRQNGPLTPFFVSLPQYRIPQSSEWNTTVTSTFQNSGATTLVNAITSAGNVSAGSPAVLLTVTKHASATSETAWAHNSGLNTPRPGDMVTFSNHTKAYLVTHVETNSIFQDATAQPTASQIKIGISPPLSQALTTGTLTTFSNPKIKVVMPQPLGDYSLNTNNLYSFNLRLEEYL